MIYDSLANADLYSGTHPLFKAAFDWIRAYDPAQIEDGRYELQGDKLIAMPQHYDTHPFIAEKFEAHKKYIDIQFIISGSEKIYLTPVDGLEPTSDFNETKDIGFYVAQGEAVTLNSSEFLIIWPHEAHAPGCHSDDTATAIHKIVLKVAI